MKRFASAVAMMAIAVAHCGNQNPPPLADPVDNATLECSVQYIPCVGGVSMGQCLQCGTTPTMIAPDPISITCQPNTLSASDQNAECQQLAQTECQKHPEVCCSVSSVTPTLVASPLSANVS